MATVDTSSDHAQTPPTVPEVMLQKFAAESTPNAEKIFEVDSRIAERIGQCVGFINYVLKQGDNSPLLRLIRSMTDERLNDNQIRADSLAITQHPEALAFFVGLEKAIKEEGVKVRLELGALREMRDHYIKTDAQES